MGQWGLRLTGGLRSPVRWYVGGAGAEHVQGPSCTGMGCAFIVEEHQRWDRPDEGDIPEFTIEVAYKTKNREGKAVTPGWRYALKWKENGELRTDRSYGWEEKEGAIAAAKRRAQEVALALAPVHVETFTPEI